MIRFVITSLMLTFGLSSVSWGDDDKLNEILKEIRTINQRLSELEKRVEALSSGANQPMIIESIDSNRKPVARPIIQFVRPKPNFLWEAPTNFPRHISPNLEAERVLRLQFENPDELLRGIHDRERRLRHRVFDVDIMPLR